MKTLRAAAPYLLAGLCLLLAGLHLIGVIRSSRGAVDMVFPWEERMKTVRQALPPDVYVVGYLEAANIPKTGTELDYAEFFMTQYGLAPVAVLKGYDHEWIIGNFGSGVSLKAIKTRLDQKLKSYTMQYLGFGLYLIHNTGS